MNIKHKKIISFFLILSLFYPSVKGQTVLNIKADFGAIGNGISDDSKAFFNASKKINQLANNIKLIIPKGVYKVIPQYQDIKATSFVPINVFEFLNCSYISIEAEKGAKIVYSNNLYYGAFEFDKQGKPKRLANKTTDYSKRAPIGHGIYVENSSHINITNLEINGNNQNFIKGNEYGDVGIQIDNDGIFIKNGNNINLTNIYFHHFGRDGIQLLNDTKNGYATLSQNINLLKCRFEYNGRGGFSWCGGVGVKATGCSFNYTGLSNISSPPQAGIDIEPNVGYSAYDGEFNNCSFIDNNGVNVLCDAGGSTSKKMVFNNCKIGGTKNAAIWIMGPSFTFNKCIINGTFHYGCPALTEQEGTQFNQCIFRDDNLEKTNTKYLIESLGSRYLQFNNCNFLVSNKSLIYVAAGSNNLDRAKIYNCKFIANYTSDTCSGFKLGNFSSGVNLSGKSSLICNTLGNKRAGYNLESTNFFGTNTAKDTIELGANIDYATFDTVNIGTKNIPVVVQVKDGALLSINNKAKLNINVNAKLILKKGATLWIASQAILNIEGQLIAEEGSFICINKNALLSNTSIKNIKLSKQPNFGENPKYNFGLSGCRNL